MKTLWDKYNRIIVYLALAVLFAAFIYISGCVHGKKLVHCPVPITNTIYVHDTVTHSIVDTFPYYINHTDTLLYPMEIPAKVDTAFILRDYFATHISDNQWRDSLIDVNIKTYISENKLKHSIFNYKILRPQSIITNTVDNSIHYAKYIYFGIDVPIKNINYINLEGILALKQSYIGIGYSPQLKSFSAKIGAKLIKFK